MRFLVRLYVAAGSVLLAVALGGAAFLGAAAWVVPEWAHDFGASAGRGLASLFPPPAEMSSPVGEGKSESAGAVIPGSSRSSIERTEAETEAADSVDAEAGLVRLERLVARLRGEPEPVPASFSPPAVPALPAVPAVSLSGTALDRVLSEPGALGDAEAVEILGNLSRHEAERALDRLARVDPRRAVVLWRLRKDAAPVVFERRVGR
jgi:hypothetical protein